MATFTAPARAAEAKKICVGRIVQVDDAYISKTSGKYYVVPIHLEALDAGKSQKVYFNWHPTFLREMSKADMNRLEQDDKSAAFTYKCNIMSIDDKKPSLLQSLTNFSFASNADNTAFNTLADRLLSIGVEAADETPTLVSDVLRQFFVEERGDELIGYVLQQQTKWTGEVDDAGKKIYEPTKYSEVGYYWQVNDKNIAKMTRKAEENPRAFKMTYSGVAF